MANTPYIKAACERAKINGFQTTFISQYGKEKDCTAYSLTGVWPSKVWGEPKLKKGTVKAVTYSSIDSGAPDILVDTVAVENNSGMAINTFNDLVSNGIDIEALIDATVESKSDDMALPIKNLFISATEMLSQKIVVRPLIGKLIERDTTGQIFGPPASGKSFIELDMGLCVATGSAWNGHQCEQGMVLYFAGEGHTGLIRRVKAWHLAHDTTGNPFLHSSRSTITFDSKGLDKVIIEGLALQNQTGQMISLIIIDTLARHIMGDENNTKDMSEFVRIVDSLRNAFPGSTAIIVHHTGNDADSSRSRGSSALKAACDFEIHCNKGSLTFTKMKDGEKPAPIAFDLIPVEVGIDDDGDSITSCTVQYNEHIAKPGEVALTAMEQILMGLIDDYPESSSDALKAHFFDKRKESVPDAKHEALKKSFGRSLTGLIEKGKIFIDGDIVKAGQGTIPGHLRDMSSETE